MNSFPQNPFTHSAFWGRQNELQTIYNRLLSQPPLSCAIIGEAYIGKTTLLRYLSDPTVTIDGVEIKDEFIFVYLDCRPYSKLAAEMGDDGSVYFWRHLNSALRIKLQQDEESSVLESQPNIQAPIDIAFEIKCELESLIQRQQRPVIFVFDNFEGIARLPLRNSDWLRSMTQSNCAYVVASRHLLYLLYQYHPQSWQNPSPLWNLFSDPIYLGLPSKDEVRLFLMQAREQAKASRSYWEDKDIDFIKKIVGRHPEMLRIACSRLYERRLQSSQPLTAEEYEFLEFVIYSDASPICNQLWHGLADPELWGIPGVAEYPKEKELWALSPHQKVLLALAKGNDSTEKDILFALEQRGLIERVDGQWRVFAEVMRQFVLKTETPDTREGMLDARIHQATREGEQPANELPHQSTSQIGPPRELREPPAFTYLEGKVYEYLKSHAGAVCDREEIKQAIWEDNLPTNSALQKIIERIREKIDDAENPRYLIAVRGQGYMLREDTSDSSMV